MNKYLLLFLSAAMISSLNFNRRKSYGLGVVYTGMVTVLELVLGLLGTKILFLIENGFWSGTSFFGAVLLLPLVFFPISLIIKEKYSIIMDLIAPSGLMMYAINKLNCYVARCCNGRLMGFTPEGIPIYFPSQVVELITVVVIAFVLIIAERKKVLKDRIYPLGLILYGISRFVLNFFREEWVTTEMYVPFGTIWSIIAVIMGLIWICLFRKRKNKEVLT